MGLLKLSPGASDHRENIDNIMPPSAIWAIYLRVSTPHPEKGKY